MVTYKIINLHSEFKVFKLFVMRSLLIELTYGSIKKLMNRVVVDLRPGIPLL